MHLPIHLPTHRPAHRPALGLLAAFVFAACGSTDDGAVAIPGADGPAPETIVTSPGENPADDPVTSEPTETSVPADAPTEAPTETAGTLGFVDVAGDRYELTESGFCVIDAGNGSTGSFLGVNASGRTGVLTIEGEPDFGEYINFYVDIGSLDLGAEGNEVSPQYEARNQEVLLIGELTVAIEGGTFAGSGLAADLNSATGFEATTPISFSATCG